jgi:hypothetical protein
MASTDIKIVSDATTKKEEANKLPEPLNKIPLPDGRNFYFMKLDKKENEVAEKDNIIHIKCENQDQVLDGEYIVFGFKEKFYPVEFPSNITEYLKQKHAEKDHIDKDKCPPVVCQFIDYTFSFKLVYDREPSFHDDNEFGWYIVGAKIERT